jgi:hypothetical protein
MNVAYNVSLWTELEKHTSVAGRLLIENFKLLGIYLEGLLRMFSFRRGKPHTRNEALLLQGTC